MIRAPMFEHKEGTLVYDCPETRRAVLTSIVTDEATLKKLGSFKLSVWCPRCMTAHIITGKESSISWLGRSLQLLEPLRL
jgi:hypothetical protein